ncbi:cephalosporin hydroxylase [Flavobacteriaceae bacterium MAR_2010_72]|nr:cephalosporin hydroxylase [Flavobacteriaceae bacterium MAR_2010_72]
MYCMEKFKYWMQKRLNGDQGYKLLHFMSRNRIAGFCIGLFYGRNLSKLAILNHTDKHKVGRHEYMKHYQMHLSRFKYKNNNLLEIGVGGYERPDRGGCSLRMWKRYFVYSNIYSIDIYDKSPQEERRIKIFKGSQNDYEFLNKVIDYIKKPIDIIIDDGSHINEHVIQSFKFLFPKLNAGGVYVVEDSQTSYREDYGGNSIDLESPSTLMNFFKKFPDYINHKEILSNNGRNSILYYDIGSIHFYHNLIFIHKKNN